MKKYRVNDIITSFGIFLDCEVEAQDDVKAIEIVLDKIMDNIGNYIDIEVEQVCEEEDDEEYKKLQSKILNIESIENLRDFFTDQKIMSLSEDDSEIILEYIQTLEDRFILALKDLFYTTLATSKYINDKFNIILSDLN